MKRALELSGGLHLDGVAGGGDLVVLGNGEEEGEGEGEAEEGEEGLGDDEGDEEGVGSGDDALEEVVEGLGRAELGQADELFPREEAVQQVGDEARAALAQSGRRRVEGDVAVDAGGGGGVVRLPEEPRDEVRQEGPLRTLSSGLPLPSPLTSTPHYGLQLGLGGEREGAELGSRGGR